jgi:GTP-binding protein Era
MIKIKKYGTVLLLGRPNVGKSTLVNTIIGQKVSITSPKPQTTRFQIHARYEDERGTIIFVDAPGIMRKTKDSLSQTINRRATQSITDDIDVVLYIVDHTRRRDWEEARVIGMMRTIKKPKILVINKIDDQEKTYLPQYSFLEREIESVVQVSALKKKNIRQLLLMIFSLLPENKSGKSYESDNPYPVLNIDSKTFLSELIREKIFLQTRKEVPYTTTVVVDEVDEKENGVLYIKARILTTEDKYKKMLIGHHGRKIKIIGSMARKEIETATSKHVYLDLLVETNKHWLQAYT